MAKGIKRQTLSTSSSEDACHGQSGSTIQEHISAFNSLNTEEQAKLTAANLLHYGDLNQAVIVRSALGLRDVSPALKDWVNHLFVEMRSHPNSKIISISERLLDENALAQHGNVLQYRVPELSDSSVTYLLAKLLNPRDTSASAINVLTPIVQGHVGSAYHVAHLVSRGGRSPESILADAREIEAYQDQSLARVFRTGVLSQLELNVLSVLSFLPSADYDLIRGALGQVAGQELSSALLSLHDSCLIAYSLNSGYRLPELVRATFRRRYPMVPDAILSRIGAVLEQRLQADDLSMASVEALLFFFTAKHGVIRGNFLPSLTPAFLHELVERNYFTGLDFHDGFEKNFEICTKLGMLAERMTMPDDTREHMLFRGGEACVRLGRNPEEIIRAMKQRSYHSVYYLIGSYHYHKERIYSEAERNLILALKARKFTARTSRLLSRIYLMDNQPSGLRLTEDSQRPCVSPPVEDA